MRPLRHWMAAAHKSRTVESLTPQTRKKGWLFTPVFADVLRDQRILRLITVIALLHLMMTLKGLPDWQCPVYATFGIPCPGCGLSTAMMLFMLGEWRAAFATHMFAPVFITGIVCMGFLSVLPDRFYGSAVKGLAFLERRTGLFGFLMIAMIVYGGIRMMGVM